MIRRLLLFLFLVVVCLLAVPNGPPLAQTPATVVAPTLLTHDQMPTVEEFAHLAKTNPMAMLNASMSRYRADVRGYTCTMEKSESVKGGDFTTEIVDVSFRDDPFAVVMQWRGKRGYVDPIATLYAKGENGGNVKVRTRLTDADTDPIGIIAQQTSRFSIQDFGIYRGTLRTYTVWKRAADQGKLKYEYVETKPIPQLNDRVCHVVRRTCDPPEVDNFTLTDTEIRSAAKFPKEAIGRVTLMFDSMTFLQVGSKIDRPDGKPLAEYYFRDLKMNPTFGPDQFKKIPAR
ncbi:DUF1571 domain-containing protein [Limnoglobus roseus]|uniref:DUF1571 domain-containing protein n=1 Tax=Limnoglobus roseus TaxID=2598579 RepID=A0A5C1AM64_9BACT|nr:DUF1571 domain-containing protein [Limnoglobus roseus]QEL19665.1 hypothetical protein PX52LOC_06742 [Limnoglobus roseus]